MGWNGTLVGQQQSSEGKTISLARAAGIVRHATSGKSHQVQ
jgi:hypothetical protein